MFLQPMRKLARFQDDGKTVMLLAVDGVLCGLICVADRIKETTPGAIRALHKAGLKIIMATGDSRRTAKVVAPAARHRRGASRNLS